jgi:hypothetical protein
MHSETRGVAPGWFPAALSAPQNVDFDCDWESPTHDHKYFCFQVARHF